MRFLGNRPRAFPYESTFTCSRFHNESGSVPYAAMRWRYVIQLASHICGFQSRSLGYTKGFPVPVLRSLFSNRLHLRPPTHVCRLAVCGKLYFRVPKRIRTGRTCSRDHTLFYSQNVLL